MNNLKISRFAFERFVCESRTTLASDTSPNLSKCFLSSFVVTSCAKSPTNIWWSSEANHSVKYYRLKLKEKFWSYLLDVSFRMPSGRVAQFTFISLFNILRPFIAVNARRAFYLGYYFFLSILWFQEQCLKESLYSKCSLRKKAIFLLHMFHYNFSLLNE